MMSTLEIRDYYEDKNVRSRILEYLGGDSFENVTSRYITGGNRLNPCLGRHRAVSSLKVMLSRGK